MLPVNSDDDEGSCLVAAEEAYLGCSADCGLHKHHPFNTFATGFSLTDEQFEARLKLYRLYDYAARNWGHHACATSAVEQLVVGFLKSEAKVSSSGQAMMASRTYPGYSQRVPRRITGPHLAAYFGLNEAMITY